MSLCPRCGGVVTVWADRSDGVTVNYRCPNETCRAGKGPWDIPEPEPVHCIRCGEPLTDQDPAVTTLGPRCRRCW